MTAGRKLEAAFFWDPWAKDPPHYIVYEGRDGTRQGKVLFRIWREDLPWKEVKALAEELLAMLQV